MNNKVFLSLNEVRDPEERWEHAMYVLGYENVKSCIPFTLEEINKALDAGDYYLHTLDMKKWDRAAGFESSGVFYHHLGSKLTNLYHEHGCHAYSCSDGVCLLKHTARVWAEKSLETHTAHMFPGVDASKMSYDEYQRWLMSSNID